ncbi:MAG: hypothetical protein WCC17_20815 [Candidatus Nitrosopolaris sp.]
MSNIRICRNCGVVFDLERRKDKDCPLCHDREHLAFGSILMAQLSWLFFHKKTIVLLSLMRYCSNNLYNSWAYHLSSVISLHDISDLRILWLVVLSVSVITTTHIIPPNILVKGIADRAKEM